MKAIIVEDELPAREELEYLIQTHSSIEVTDSFEDGLDVFRFLQDQETDAIFLDINIPSLDGMLLAQNISKFAKKPYIIFTTAYKEHAAQALNWRRSTTFSSHMMKNGSHPCYISSKMLMSSETLKYRSLFRLGNPELLKPAPLLLQDVLIC